jgi:long-chain acyl-CoA synthetase
VFSGYLDDAAANREAFADSGWFRTGDLGYLDRAGYLHVVGRKTETITLPTGKKLFLEDVEAAYAGVPFVKDLAVLLQDNALVALIVLEPEAIRERGAARVEGLLREAIELHRAGLKPQERIGGYAIHRGALPRTHLGKLKRHLLPALYAQIKARLVEPEPVELSPADRDLLQRPLSAEIWRWLESLYPDRKLTLDTSPQLDLGVDSLHWIELTAEIQDRFGARLTEAAIARVLTLRDLLQEISQSAAAPRPAPVAPATLPEPPGPAHLALGFLLYAAIAITLRLLFRLSVRGRANIPVDGPVVFAPNHASYLDPVTLAAAFRWSELRRTCWGGWTAILFAGRFMRALSRAANVLPVDPDRDPGGALALAVTALREGRRLVWFPEGRMSPTGELGDFLPGVGRLLAETDAPAVPVRIGGSFAALPRGRRIPRLRRLSVIFGPPVSRAELAERGGGKDAETRIADALRACVDALPER